MQNNLQQRKDRRKLSPFLTIKPADKHTAIGMVLKLTDMQFPPLLKMHSFRKQQQPDPSTTPSSPPLAAPPPKYNSLSVSRKNSIFPVKVQQDLKQMVLSRILKQHKDIDKTTIQANLQDNQFFKSRLSSLFGNRKIIHPNKIGLPTDKNQMKVTSTTKKIVNRYTDPIPEQFLDQKELTVHKKFIETTMNSISYERDRMREALKKEKEFLRSIKHNSLSFSPPKRMNSTLNDIAHNSSTQIDSDTMVQQGRNNEDSPRRRTSRLNQYDPPTQTLEFPQLRPWTNNLVEE